MYVYMVIEREICTYIYIYTYTYVYIYIYIYVFDIRRIILRPEPRSPQPHR